MIDALLPIFEMSYDDALKLFNLVDTKDLDKVYRKMAMQHHPDRGGSVEMMQKINQAYELLKGYTKDNFQKAKSDAFDKRKSNYIRLKAMSTELVNKIKLALPSYESHFAKYFKLNPPQISLKLDEPNSAWGYDLATIEVKFESDNNSMFIKLVVNIWADSNKENMLSGDSSQYVINYDTFVYHNKKLHRMVKSKTLTWGKSSGDVLVPAIVFPPKRLEAILKKTSLNMSKKDFEAALVIEFKKYQAAYERSFGGFILHRPITDDIVPVLYRSTILRRAAWTIMFKRKTKNSLSAAVLPKSSGGALPPHIKNITFTLPESAKGLELLKSFFEDIYSGKSVDSSYFKSSYDTNESIDFEMCEGDKYKLMGSAASLEDLKKIMKEKLYWSTVLFKEISKGEYEVSNVKGAVDGTRVILKSGRYRLEYKV
jgi:curved DNA-binding protein CbpA